MASISFFSSEGDVTCSSMLASRSAIADVTVDLM